MRRVLRPGKTLLCLLAAVAGCSAAPRQARIPGPPDWREGQAARGTPTETERVPEPPRFAPPPAAVSHPPAPAPGTYAETWIPLDRWSRENHVGTLRRISLVPAPTFALTTPEGVFEIQVNNLVAKWNGLELHLGFKPQLIDDQPFLHVLDLKKNLEPLLQNFTLPAGTNRVIVIDPGHGGQNTGARSVLDDAEEKVFTLDWASRLAAVLATNGWQVFLTRTNDVDLALSNRVAFAEEHEAALFISLHFNSAAPSREQAGVETFCLTPTGMPSTLTRGYEDNVALVFTNNAFDAENLQYAVRLQRALLRVDGVQDRGVRRARFLGVLRSQNRPAVLIEGGYLSNPHEAGRIADPAYRQELAEALADALVDRPEPGHPVPDAASLTSARQPPTSTPPPPGPPTNDPSAR
jgi:N-acetylmuramoyl-L-alanine amidase